jgi:chaperone required for assembly of F1-ATPase
VARGFKEPGEKPRRFYTAVSFAPEAGGFLVKLDARAVRTPGGARLVLPAEALAQQVAAEWAAQGDHLEMARMHATRLANTAIDAIPGARDATAAGVAQFAASDLLCYRADSPAALVARQAERWDPILARAEQEAGLSFLCAQGIVHQAQPAETGARVKALALELDDFRLAGLSFGTSLYGSAVLAIAALRGWTTASEAFELSRLDEAWQEEKWGEDVEAPARTTRLRAEAGMLERWFRNLD